ncbi:A-kinase anchoring protein 7 isoform X6 [Delphinus delphis]|nr:A-kinase anchoring protein 7 isoform X6 [Delphinus delphis]
MQTENLGFFSPLNFPVQLPHLSAGERTGCGLFSITFLKDTSAEPRSARGTHLRARELSVLRELGERRATSFPESQSQSSCVGLEPGEAEPFCSRRRVPPPLPASLPACLPAGRVSCAATRRAPVLLRGPWDKPQSLFGEPWENTRKERERASAMGQLCCFPFSRDEEKISDKNGGEPDDAELVRLSKRLVENAVLKAVQQYLEETQNKNKPGDGSSVKTEEADRNGTDSDNNRK